MTENDSPEDITLAEPITGPSLEGLQRQWGPIDGIPFDRSLSGCYIRPFFQLLEDFARIEGLWSVTFSDPVCWDCWWEYGDKWPWARLCKRPRHIEKREKGAGVDSVVGEG